MTTNQPSRSRPPTGKTANRQAARERTAQERAAEAAAARRRQRTRLAVVVGAVILVAVIVVIVVQTRRGAVDESAAVPANATEAAAFEVGSADAPIVIDVYEDFLCPVCRDFEDTAGDTLGSLVDDGSIRLRYRPIAILDLLSTDDYSTRAATRRPWWPTRPASRPSWRSTTCCTPTSRPKVVPASPTSN